MLVYVLNFLGFVCSVAFPQNKPIVEPAIKRPPTEIKAIYVTSYTSRSSRMEELIKLVDDTELNAMVINFKEPTGVKNWPGLDKLILKLHQKNIWVIARIVVFQDDDLPKRDTRFVLRQSGGGWWRDRGGSLWLDPAAREVWQYNADVAKQALALGFDEINLDYIRFSSDGQVSSIIYPIWNKKQNREQVISDFAKYITREIKNYRPYAIVSADVFGYTLVRDWDVEIGQRAKILAQYFDVLAPMLYPSHYYPGSFGFTNPAEHPYEVVKETLLSGQEIVKGSNVIIRPWLQDFNMGAQYTKELVQAQIKAVEEAGLNQGWFLWNPQNRYTESALQHD